MTPKSKFDFKGWMLALLLAAPVAASASQITVFNTGVNNSGNALTGADPHWIDNTYGGQAVVLDIAQYANPAPTWAFIGVQDSGSEPPAPYSFSQTFSLAGLDPTTAVLAGTFAIDDYGTLSLNGHVIDTLGAYGLNQGQSNTFSVDGSSGFFNAGQNTLTINFLYTDQYLDATALILNQGTARSLPTSSVPDSSGTAELVACALVGIGLMRRKLRKEAGLEQA